jgi:hypothetical protein
MASTYSTNLKIQLMTTGENTGTWGSVTNVNLGTALEEAIIGSTSVAFNGADVTLTLTNSNASQTARNLRLVLTGTSGGARQLVVPALEKTFIIKNELSDTCTVLVSGQTGVAVPAGKTMWLYNDGTDVKDVTTHLSSLTLASALPVASGGTGLNAAGTAGNALISNGTAWASQAITTFSSGMILLWSGTIATIPAGWVLCNGSNGTPDLRNRFIIGAFQDNAGSAVTTVTGANTTSGGSATLTPAGSISVTGTALTEAQMPKHFHSLRGPNGPFTSTVPSASASGSGNYGGGTPDDGTTGYGTNSVGGNAASGSASTGTSDGDTHTHTATFTGSSGSNLPPYYALAYIMKT